MLDPALTHRTTGSALAAPTAAALRESPEASLLKTNKDIFEALFTVFPAYVPALDAFELLGAGSTREAQVPSQVELREGLIQFSKDLKLELGPSLSGVRKWGDQQAGLLRDAWSGARVPTHSLAHEVIATAPGLKAFESRG